MVIQCAELFRKGLPPVAGGSLDQAAIFVDAARFVWGEQAYWRAHFARGWAGQARQDD